MKQLIWLLVTALIPVPWMFLELTGLGHHMDPVLV
jgi:hypothetical protein